MPWSIPAISSSADSLADRVQPGTSIAGFAVGRRLGAGSAGTVYEATQPSLGRTVALRLLDQGRFDEPEFAARFSEQQARLAALHHPNIVPTYEAGEWDGGRFVATRYVRGGTFAERLADSSFSRARADEVRDE